MRRLIFVFDKTKLINQKNDMRIVDADIQATISSQKFMGMDKAAKLVTFSGTGQNFKDACTRSGGIPREVKNAGIVCGGTVCVRDSRLHNLSLASMWFKYRCRYP
jgi:hypothetical protein